MFFFNKIFYWKVYLYFYYSKYFKLGYYYHNFLLQCIIKNYNIFFTLFYFINDVFFFVNKNYIKLDLNLKFINLNLTDMAFFLEKRNSVGFFNLSDPLYIRLNFISGYFNKLCLNQFLLYLKF